MNINYSFRGFETHSDGLKDYAGKRLEKIEKMVGQNTLVDVIFIKDKNEKTTEIKVNHNGDDFFATEKHDEFDASIDFCVDKIYKQLVKAKEKKVDSRKV